MPTLLVTLPQTAFAAGASGASLVGAVPAGLQQAALTINQVAWPNTGGTAASFEADVSQDGGATWSFLAAATFNDVPVLGSNPTQITLTCSIPNPASATRLVRLAYNFAKALTVSGTLVGN